MSRPDDPAFPRKESGEGPGKDQGRAGAPSPGHPTVFFHVGLGKAASTWMQQAFFPRLEGLRYIPRTRYRRSPDIIRRGGSGPWLVSREFDRQLEREARWFAGHFPQAKPIVVFRRHDAWIASQYRRHVKNGSPLTFPEFFDVENDAGHWKRRDLLFMPMRERLQELFGSDPLVLFHEELRHDPRRFMDRVAAFTGARYDPDRVSLDPVHRSYSDRRLKFMRRVSRRLFPEPIRHGRLPWWRRRVRLLACYAVLGIARLAPEADSGEPLIDPADLARVREAFADDWAAVRAGTGGRPGRNTRVNQKV